MKRRNSTGSAGSKSSSDSSNHSGKHHNHQNQRGSDDSVVAVPRKRSSAKHQTKRIKFESKKGAAPQEPTFAKLDPSNPEHARRIQQRRKTVSYGKNTLGYEEYIKQVPKEKRRMRSMKTPMTPDATLDIPTSRWTGMVRAW
jgi:histone RNA hairpin-binding protein